MLIYCYQSHCSVQCECETAMVALCGSLCLCSSFRLLQITKFQYSTSLNNFLSSVESDLYTKCLANVQYACSCCFFCVYEWAVGMAHRFSWISITNLTDFSHVNLTGMQEPETLCLQLPITTKLCNSAYDTFAYCVPLLFTRNVNKFN